MRGPGLFGSHPLVEEWFRLHESVSPETPIEELERISWLMWDIYQQAEREAPGAILERLDTTNPKRHRRRVLE